MGPGPAGIPQLEYLFSRLVCVSVPLGYTILLVILVIAGIKYLTSGGEPKAVQAAHHTVTWGLLGIVFLALAWLILQLIQNFTGVEVTKFTLASLPGVQGFTGSCWESPPVAPEPTPQPKPKPVLLTKPPPIKDVVIHKIQCNNSKAQFLSSTEGFTTGYGATPIVYRTDPHEIEGFPPEYFDFVFVNESSVDETLYVARSLSEAALFVKNNIPGPSAALLIPTSFLSGSNYHPLFWGRYKKGDLPGSLIESLHGRLNSSIYPYRSDTYDNIVHLVSYDCPDGDYFPLLDYCPKETKESYIK